MKALKSQKKTESHIYDRIYDITCLIPEGRVTTYGAIARAIGSSQSSRLVGYALNNCHQLEKFIPAHRVVNRNGLLTGKHHFGGEHVMQQLLESEGIEVVDDKVIRFTELFWDPMKELFNINYE
jgi:methylated-DNA-protein-cysteine methyltransferase-like protein